MYGFGVIVCTYADVPQHIPVMYTYRLLPRGPILNREHMYSITKTLSK